MIQRKSITMREDRLILGCGYLGQRVAAAWQRDGHRVHVVTRSALRAAEFAGRGWIPHVADVGQPETLSVLPRSAVVLYAIGFDRSGPHTQQQITLDGQAAVFDRISGYCRRWIMISSTSVYGQSAGEWVDEQSLCAPQQPGGQINLAAEQMIWDRASQSRTGLTATVLRLSGIYGPQRLLSKVEQLRAGQPLAGSGDSWLNLIHVDDACQTVIKASGEFGAGETVLVTDDQPLLRREYYARLAELVSAPPPQFDMSQAARHGAGGQNKRCRNHKLTQQWRVSLRFPTVATGLPAAWLDTRV
jgi:nucleoside-diphosphate-sugar epimerase